MKQKSKILLFIDDKVLTSSVTKELQKLHCVLSFSKENPMSTVFDEVPHLIVVDENFKGGEGQNIALGIKNDVVLQYIPIILLHRQGEKVHKHFSKIDHCLPKEQLRKRLVPAAKEILTKNHNELDLNPLTSLPGTRSTVLHIEQAIRSHKLFAVCCVDLSNLAAFNSTYGDARGDEIIVRLSQIVKEVLSVQGTPDDFLGHLGGDDLIFLTRSSHAVGVCEAIIQKFDATITDFYDPHDREQGHIVQRNAEGILTEYGIMSINIAIVHNDHMPLTEMSQISRIAGELMRYMKNRHGSSFMKDRRQRNEPHEADQRHEIHFPGKAGLTHVSNGVDAKIASFREKVLKHKNIRAVYQPIVELRTQSVVGYEALTRALSDFPADEATLLFNVARESGHVKELDKICVECALKSAQKLSPEKKLFINLNHETLIDPRYMRTLFTDKGVIGYKSIVIEVTEQSILRSFDKIRDALMELKEQGVSVAIDDVGGGAVSLRDVAILKPNYIKFDRSLIRQIDTSTTKQQIVLSMILFAKGINAITTAEGIQTKEEYEAVLNCGASLGQGYFFAKPGALP